MHTYVHIMYNSVISDKQDLVAMYVYYLCEWLC